MYGFLRFMRGEWPPDARSRPLLADFRTHLERYRYRPMVITNYISAARQFLLHLEQQSVPVEQARPQHIDGFIQMKLESQTTARRSAKEPLASACKVYRPIRRLLRMLNPNWPPPEPPANDCERFQRELLDG